MKKQISNAQRGVAMMLALLTLLILSALAAGLMFSADTETAINGNYRSEQQAYFASRAGLEEGRIRMMRPVPITAPALPNTGDLFASLPTNVPGGILGTPSAGDMIYITNPTGSETVAPWTAGTSYFDDELCHENVSYSGITNVGTGVRCQSVPTTTYYSTSNSKDPNTSTAAAMPYKWVRITLKQNASSANTTVDGQNSSASLATAHSTVCFDGSKEVLMPVGYAGACTPLAGNDDSYRPVYVLTSLAVTPNGARRFAQMEVADMPPIWTNAAVDTNDNVTINGSSVTANGYDYCSCDCTIGKGNAVIGCPARSGYTGGHCDSPGTPWPGPPYSIYSTGTNSGAGNQTPAYQQNQSSFKWDIPTLITEFESMPNAVNCSDVSAPCAAGAGSPPPGMFASSNYPNGLNYTQAQPVNPWQPGSGQTCANMPTSPATNWCQQVSYYKGDTSLGSHYPGAGVLVVDGNLTITGGMQFYGLVVVRGTITTQGSGSGQVVDITGSLLNGSGVQTTSTVGGGFSIQYNSCALKMNQYSTPPLLLSSREVSY